MAASKLRVKRSQIVFVAAHSWDIAGAAHAGCRTCFVLRPDQALDELTPKPDYNVADLVELAHELGC